MAPVDLDIAIGADHQQTGSLQVAREVKKEVDGAAVGVVQVFEDDQERLNR